MKVEVDWADWSFGPGRHPVMGAVVAGLTACSVTMVAAVWGLPGWWLLAAGATLATVSAAAAAWQQQPGVVVGYRAGVWIGAGAWSAATLTWAGPWSRGPLITLAVGTTVVGMVGAALSHRQQQRQEATRKEAERQAAAQAAKKRGKEVARWQQLIQKVSGRQVTVHQLTRWQPPTGFTLECELPPDGTTVGELKALESRLAHAADLPDGCGVEVLASRRGRRWALIRIATVNAMVEDKDMPADLSPLSINDPLPIGVYSDGTSATITLRFTSGALVGQVGSGKSNTLNVSTHQLARCPDVLIWAIDLSGGGRMPRPWVRAWHEGRATRPVIDWVGNSRDEALRLCDAAIAIINGRTPAYQQLMAEADDDKLPVSAKVPQIIILVDEFADLPGVIKDRLETISNTGRGAGVRIMTCVLRATAVEIPRGLVVQAATRIAMKVSDEGELQYLFDRGWGTRIDTATAAVPGTGWVSTGGPAQLFKAWRLKPSRIDEVSVELAERRPQLDEVSAGLAGAGYAGRWQRVLPVMFPTSGTVPAPRPPADPAPATTTSVSEESGMDLDRSADRLRAAMAAVQQAADDADTARDGSEGDVPGLDFDQIEGWLAEQAPAGQTPAADRPEPRQRMRQLVQEQRRDGIGPTAVHQVLQAEGYPTSRQTVITWMRADAAAGVLAQPGGKGQPYVPGPRFTVGP